MGFVHNSKVQPGRVRVTKRIMSDPDRNGARTLVARPGEEISLQEAVRRRIPDSALEAVGHGGELALSEYRKTVKRSSDDEARAAAAAAADQAALEAETAAQRARERKAAEAAGAAPAGGFPRQRGGANWELSDGRIFTGTVEEAEEAEAALSGSEASEDTDPAAGKVDEVLARVADDPEAAAAALEAETAKGDKARSTLVEQLQAIVSGGGSGDDQ